MFIMLEPLKYILDSSKIVLASASPRRKEILETLGLNIIIKPSNVEENLNKTKYVGKLFDYTVDTAELKADDVFGKVKEEYMDKDLIVVGSDTVVTKDDVIYEKPKDVDDAYRILNILNGKCHTVYSGVKIIFQSKSGVIEMIKFYEATDVKLLDLSEDVIRTYIATGEPMDKAGGYGIQGLGSNNLVEHIREQSIYFNLLIQI